MDGETNLQRGVYRLIYQRALYGERINSVSVGAEFWFWRLHLIADDFGNVEAKPKLCRRMAAPCRDDLTDEQVIEWMEELATSGLIVRYESAGKPYAHIIGWEHWQPRARNGKPIRRYPACPTESGAIQCNPKIPDESSSRQRPDTDTDTDSDSHSQNNIDRPACADHSSASESNDQPLEANQTPEESEDWTRQAYRALTTAISLWPGKLDGNRAHSFAPQLRRLSGLPDRDACLEGLVGQIRVGAKAVDTRDIIKLAQSKLTGILKKKGLNHDHA